MELHMKYTDAAAPTTAQGVLEVKVKFLDEIASKARSLIAERDNEKSCDLQCAQLAMYVIVGLEDVHRHHEDIGRHIMELRQKFDDIKSAADDVLREIDSVRGFLSKWQIMYFIGIVICGSFAPTFADVKIDYDKYLLHKLVETMVKAIPFMSPIVWDLFTNGVKKKDVLEEIRTTATRIQKAATLVYRVLDEDILPAISPADPAPTSPFDHAALSTPPDATASPSYHTTLSTPPNATANPSYHTAHSTPDPTTTPSTSAADKLVF